jgi:hypothetical protein
MHHRQGGFLRLPPGLQGIADLSSSLRGDSQMPLKRWLSGFREPVCNQTGEHQ